MSPSKEFIERQIRRLDGMRGFPHTEEGVEDLATAFAEASSEKAIESFITEWKRTYPYAPTPADIYAALGAPEEPRYWKIPEPTKCDKCGDTGWRIITKGMNTGALRCECRPLPPTEPTDEGKETDARTKTRAHI